MHHAGIDADVIASAVWRLVKLGPQLNTKAGAATS